MLDDIEHLKSVSQSGAPLGRRGFVVTSLATGFALGAGPVQAQSAITTDSASLIAGEVKIPVAGGEIPAYRAKPADATRPAVVLVVQEVFGVHEYIKDTCRRLAKAGYCAVAPELYARQGDASKLTDIAQILEIVGRVPDAQVMSDLDATAQWASSADGADADRLAITGFCWGGRIVWLYAAHNQRLTAGVAWYGRVMGETTPLTPKHPIDLVARINAPVLGLYAGADAGILEEDVDMFLASLKAAGKRSDIHTYPDMPHGFHADYRQSYRREAADDGWRRLLAWFRQNRMLA